MTRTRAMTFVVLAAAALVLAACSGRSDTASLTAGTPVSSAPGGSTETTGTITYAHEEEWFDYNANSVTGNATANSVLLNQVLRGFYYVDDVGVIHPDTEFGTFEKASDNPLTVKYSFNENAVWSDGTPIGCADFLLTWASNSGRYNKDGSLNQGTDRPADPAYLFDAGSMSGIDQTEKPTCADGDKTVTLVYAKPFVDWQAAILGPLGPWMLPAHVAAKSAGIDTSALVKAVETDDVATLTKVAEFWNTGWTLDKSKGLPDASLLPSAGPYHIAAWDPGQSVTLKKNDKWWGVPAQTDTIVVRFIAQDQQVAALQSSEVDIIEPQPNPDTTAALAALGDSVQSKVGSKFTYEHVDLNVKNGFAKEKLREAFFKCAPRQQIVDNLIVPANPEANLLNSLTTMDFQPGYEAAAAASGFQAYDQVDLEGARTAYNASGEAAGKAVRIINIQPNPRTTNEVALIKASCDQVGFSIQDTPLAGGPFGETLSAGDYDAALFAWAGSGLNGSLPQLYLSNGPSNSSGWTDPDIDAALNAIATTTNPGEVPALLAKVDQGLAKNFYSYPIFTFPGFVAYKNDIEGVTHNATQTQASWNMQEWSRIGS